MMRSDGMSFERLSRRRLLKLGAAAVTLHSSPQIRGSAQPLDDRPSPVRVGFVGVGLRGSHLLDVVLRRMANVMVPAVCDTDAKALARARQMVTEAGQPILAATSPIRA